MDLTTVLVIFGIAAIYTGIALLFIKRWIIMLTRKIDAVMQAVINSKLR